MGKIVAISVLVVLFGITGADADIAELDLFDLGCQLVYDFDSPYWQTDFDLGVAFTEISHVYIDWSGEITAGLATNPFMPGPQPFPCDVGIYASLGFNPSLRRITVWGGEVTYPEPQVFDFRSEFELLGSTTWSDLLDGQGTITIGYTQLVGPYLRYVESGFVELSSATLIVEGTPVPEPATVIFLALGVLGLCVGRRKR